MVENVSAPHHIWPLTLPEQATDLLIRHICVNQGLGLHMAAVFDLQNVIVFQEQKGSIRPDLGR